MKKRNHNRFCAVSPGFCICAGQLARNGFKIFLFVAAILLSGTSNLHAEANSGMIGNPGVSAFIESAQTNSVLRIGLVDCIAWTLQNNSEILIKKIEPELREEDLKVAKAAFEPGFYANLKADVTKTPVLIYSYSPTVSKVMEAGAGLSGELLSGTRYQFDLLGSRDDNNSSFRAVNPVYSAGPKITVTQPLFRGAGFEVNRAEIVIAANYRRISSRGVKAAAMESVSGARIAYYNYCYALEFREKAALSLKRCQDLLAINTEQHAKGLISSVDLLETDTAVAESEKLLIVAEALVAKMEDELKLITNLVDDPELWNARLEPINRPQVELRKTDLAQSLKHAFEFRPDYEMKKIDLQNREVVIKVADDNLLPTIDLVGSYGMNGLGADFGGALNTIEPESSAWTVGLKFSRLWGGAERARYVQKKREKTKALLELKRLEQNIIFDVRNRIREVETQRRQMDAARRSQELELKIYAAQKERYAAGQTSTHDMLDYQERVAKSEIDYLKALVDYQNALILLDNAEGTTLARNNIVLEE